MDKSVSSGWSSLAGPPADLVLVGARVVQPGAPLASELVLAGGRVAAVGHRVTRPAGVRVVDLRGAVVVPGLADAHCHLVGLATTLAAADLRGARSVEELAQRAAAHAAGLPAGAWAEGAGWDENTWHRPELPTHHALSAAIPDRPAVLLRVDGHALLANAAALALCAVAEAPDPPDGLILRQDGAPTGVLVDGAMRLVLDHLPTPDPARLRPLVREASRRAAAAGLTCVHDMGLREPELELLIDMAREGELSCRVHAYIAGEHPKWTESLQIRRNPVGLLTIGGVKLYQDGALGSRGAALDAPYCDAPGCRGLVLHEPAELAERLRAADAAGHQVAVHAIGDRAFGQVLGALEALGRAAGPRDRRPRVEHAQVASASLFARAAAVGAVLSMQPVHAVGDASWAGRRLGPDRLAWSYAWAQAAAAGCHLALGTDFPVEPLDPLATLRAATGHHPGFAAGPRALSPEQALRGATEGAAWAIYREGELGRLAPGMAADLTILDVDPLGSPERLADARVLATLVGGRPTHVDRAAELDLA